MLVHIPRLCLTLILLLFSLPTFASSAAVPEGFLDVPVDAPYAEAARQLTARGIVRGYADGHFGPDDPLLRAQAAVTVARAMGAGVGTASRNFSDQGATDEESWAAVRLLADRDIARGFPDGTFQPTGKLTRQQAISFVSRMMVMLGQWQAQPTTALSSDVAPDHRADVATYVRYVGGIPPLGDVHPAESISLAVGDVATRGWYAEMLWCALATSTSPMDNPSLAPGAAPVPIRALGKPTASPPKGNPTSTASPTTPTPTPHLPTPSPTATPLTSPVATPTATARVTPTPSSTVVAPPAPPARIAGLHVSGNQIRNGADQPIQLLGINRSGTEYTCLDGWGVFDGPSDAAAVRAIASWHTNAVRLPLNEDCWLGINGGPAATSGEPYRRAIRDYVTTLNAQGLVAILDLHWNAPGTTRATGQQPMPDRDHALAFWASVGATFKDNSSVVFDLYNEPAPDYDNWRGAAAWTCWRDGGSCSGVPFEVAGMQELVNAVRGTGARNILMASGINHGNHIDDWLTYRPTDPTGNLVAGVHLYNFNGCNDQICWENSIAPVARQVPVVVGELGQNDCAHWFIDPLMGWLDVHGIGYIAWTWDTWSDCGGGPVLITDYNGTPTNFGIGFRDHLAALATRSPLTATAP